MTKFNGIIGNPLKNIKDFYSLVRHPRERINELHRTYIEKYGKNFPLSTAQIARYCAEGVGIEILVETTEQIGLPALLTLAVGPKAGAVGAVVASFTHYGHIVTPLYIGWRIRGAIRRAQNNGSNYRTPNDLEHTV